jgi:hypothetical protein
LTSSARQEEELLNIDNEWTGFQVPRFSPPTFVPIVWANGGDWIKVLRVPVDSGNASAK